MNNLFEILDNAADGAFVIDEEQDGPYKQAERPRYNGRDLAVVIVSLMFREDAPGMEDGKREDHPTDLLTLGELQGTISRFLGRERTETALMTHLRTDHLEAGALATPATVQFSERLLAGSISLTFFVYVFVNTAMVTGLVPVVGIPLPLVSFGGTSMVTLLAGFGILMSIHSHRKLLPH